MHVVLPRREMAGALREDDAAAPAAAAAPSMLPPAALRYASAPIQRRAAAGGISAAENEAVRRLSANRVDLHAMGATVQHVPASDPRLQAVGARSLTQGSHALVGDAADRGHELWHMAQQAMGQVRTTERIGGHAVNAEPILEREADRMGALIGRHAAPSPAPAPWQTARPTIAAPIQRQVTKFKSTTDKRLPPTADLIKSLDYDNFVDDEDDVVTTIDKKTFNPKKTNTPRPKKIEATVAPNSNAQGSLKRSSHKSGVVGKMGADNYFLASGAWEVFEGGHLIPHELWSDKDAKKDSADDYANLVPMSRTMNVGQNDHTWREQEKVMIGAYEKGKTFSVTVDLDTPNVLDYNYGRLGELFGLGIVAGQEDETVRVYNWLPKLVSIAEDKNNLSFTSAFENEIFNVHESIDDGPALIAVLQQTPIWNRCDPDLQEALEDL